MAGSKNIVMTSSNGITWTSRIQFDYFFNSLKISKTFTFWKNTSFLLSYPLFVFTQMPNNGVYKAVELAAEMVVQHFQIQGQLLL